MSLYASDGSFNVTVVDGTAPVGAQAADGGLNVFQVDGTSPVGVYNASGAINVVVTEDDQTSKVHPCGGIFVSVSPYALGTEKVTVTAGSFA